MDQMPLFPPPAPVTGDQRPLLRDWAERYHVEVSMTWQPCSGRAVARVEVINADDDHLVSWVMLPWIEDQSGVVDYFRLAVSHAVVRIEELSEPF